MTLSDAELTALRGQRFPGGRRRIEHWESFLLTDCTGAAQLPVGMVHPVALFHVPIQGCGTSISELFSRCGTAEQPGAVGIESYDWEYQRPLREGVEYAFVGGIDRAERHATRSGVVYDLVTFSIEMSDADGLVARVTNCWRIWRGRP